MANDETRMTNDERGGVLCDVAANLSSPFVILVSSCRARILQLFVHTPLVRVDNLIQQTPEVCAPTF